MTCRFCNEPLMLQDISVKTFEAQRVMETVGTVTVENKGTIISDRIHCGGRIVRGKGKGTVDGRGPMLEVAVRGDVNMPTLAAERLGPGLTPTERYGRIF